jgi:lipoprotein Spr
MSFSNSKQVASTKPAVDPKKEKDIKFIDNIAVNPSQTTITTETKIQKKESGPSASTTNFNTRVASVEAATALELKYAVLLNTEVEQIEETELLRSVDEWYGVRYRMGGTTRKGVDCSAFVQAVYVSAFTLSIPRTAFEQYKAAIRISATELKEGDLVFFNTTGGVSHVGIYLKNNKFIHASSSNGVTVSDLFEPYYLKRFLGAGRFPRQVSASN